MLQALVASTVGKECNQRNFVIKYSPSTGELKGVCSVENWYMSDMRLLLLSVL